MERLPPHLLLPPSQAAMCDRVALPMYLSNLGPDAACFYFHRCPLDLRRHSDLPAQRYYFGLPSVRWPSIYYVDLVVCETLDGICFTDPALAQRYVACQMSDGKKGIIFDMRLPPADQLRFFWTTCAPALPFPVRPLEDPDVTEAAKILMELSL